MIHLLCIVLPFVVTTSSAQSAKMAKYPTKAQDELGAITKKSILDGEKSFPYWLYIPKQAENKKAAPLILFLHGSGEREGGAKGPHQVGIGPAITKQGDDFPFFVIMPQFSKRGSWRGDGEDAKRAMKILEEVKACYKIDDKRLYLTGLSMGGNGTWEFAMAYPKKWAAIAPVCGFYGDFRSIQVPDTEKLKVIKDIPCWCFHGDKDRAVPISKSRAMMSALWSLGAHPNYTEYPGVEHNCWDLTYANPQLYRWFLAHQRVD